MSVHTAAAGNLHLARHVAERFLKPVGVRAVMAILDDMLNYEDLTPPMVEFMTRRLCIAYHFMARDLVSLAHYQWSYFVPTIDMVSV